MCLGSKRRTTRERRTRAIFVSAEMGRRVSGCRRERGRRSGSVRSAMCTRPRAGRARSTARRVLPQRAPRPLVDRQLVQRCFEAAIGEGTRRTKPGRDLSRPSPCNRPLPVEGLGRLEAWSGEAWRFSAATVAQIPELYEERSCSSSSSWCGTSASRSSRPPASPVSCSASPRSVRSAPHRRDPVLDDAAHPDRRRRHRREGRKRLVMPPIRQSDVLVAVAASPLRYTVVPQASFYRSDGGDALVARRYTE